MEMGFHLLISCGVKRPRSMKISIVVENQLLDHLSTVHDYTCHGASSAYELT